MHVYALFLKLNDMPKCHVNNYVGLLLYSSKKTIMLIM